MIDRDDKSNVTDDPFDREADRAFALAMTAPPPPPRRPVALALATPDDGRTCERCGRPRHPEARMRLCWRCFGRQRRAR